MLAARVPLGDGELPASFCSRLALRNGRRRVERFCDDMGIKFRNIINGNSGSLEALASLGGVSEEGLLASALRKEGDHLIIGKEILNRTVIRSSESRLCPACIEEDRQRWTSLGDVAPYFRTVWLVSGVSTCVRHNLALIVAPEAKDAGRLDRYRIPALGRAIWDRAIARQASPFEGYVVKRVAGVLGNNWLDDFPLYAAVKACQHIGGAALAGQEAKFWELSDNDQFQAGALGFQILSAGADSFRSFLTTYRQERGRLTGDPGLTGTFGQLYRWLAHNTKDSSYDPLREIVRDVALDSLAFDEDERIFGQPVGARRVHSIYTAAQVTGISRPTMRTFLHEHGFIRDEDLGKTDDAILMPVSYRLTEFLDELRSALTLSQAAERLGTTRRQTEHLVDTGLITPINSNMESHNKYSFSPREIDRFLRVLLKDVPEVDPREKGLVDIATAALKATCRSVDVVFLILARRLSMVRFTRAANGYNSVLVGTDEVRVALGKSRYHESG